jgi:Thioesterase-like superfamily
VRASANAFVVDGFYHRTAGATFEATDATTSPWDQCFQHAGPPLALIARIVDERFANDAMRMGRVTLDIFGPIPKVDLTIETQVLRPGKRIELIEARLRSGGKDVLVASVWRFAVLRGVELPASVRSATRAGPPGPEARIEMWDGSNGYFRAFEWRAERGSPREFGPAAVWCRTDLPLITGEPPVPRDTLLALADSANGVSLELPLESWLSIPASVTLTLARDPVGEWVSLDANTLIGPDGRGLTTGILGDRDGVAGNIVQALLVSPRTR